MSDLGPLHYIVDALQEQLKLVFPERLFTHDLMPGRLDKAEWERLVRREPFVGLGFLGVPPRSDDGRVFEGTAQISVLLVTKNAGVVRARFFGDGLGPGLFEMLHVAIAALHGFTINPDGTLWEAQGTARVKQAANVATPDWVAAHIAIAELMVEVPFQLTLPEALSGNGNPGDLTTIAASWNFQADSSTASPTDLITLGTSS